MNKFCYDPELDYRIIEIIEHEGETRFNILVDLLGTGPKTISRHLEFLSNDKQKILEWTKNPHGKKGSIKLTTTTIIKRKYGIFSIDYSHKRGLCSDWRKHHTETSKKSDRKTKLMLFLLLVFASGYMSYKNSSKGGIVIRGRENDITTTKTVAITDESEYGFSPDDLIRDDYQLSTIHTSMRLNRFSKEEVEDLLNEFVNTRI